jgi:hypothetical protein
MRLVALGLFAAVISCDTIVTPTQTVQQGGGGGATPAAVSVNPAVAPTIDSVSLEVVEAAGCAEASGILHPGCVARITATPRFHGVAVSPAVHGPICTWLLDGAPVAGSASTNVVYVTETTNAFNLTAFGQAPGTFTLEAEVMSVRSGPRRFAVR